MIQNSKSYSEIISRINLLYSYLCTIPAWFSNESCIFPFKWWNVNILCDFDKGLFLLLKHLNFAVNETAEISFLTHSPRKSQSVRQLRWEQNISQWNNETEKSYVKTKVIFVLKRGLFCICCESIAWKYILSLLNYYKFDYLKSYNKLRCYLLDIKHAYFPLKCDSFYFGN